MAKPKLCLIPAAQGLKLYSVLPSSGVGDFDFSRSGSATRINSQGLIETVASGVSRLNYPLIDGVVKGCPSHLLEPSRTNIIPRSEDIDTGWSKSNATVANNQTISPNGTLNAGLVTATSTTGQHILYDNLIGSVTAGADYFTSCFVKKSTTRYIRLTDGYSGGIIYIDLDTNSIIDEDGGASETIMENYGNGWFRVGFKFTADSSGNSQFALYVNDNSNNNAYAGSGEAVYVYGFQIEQGSYPTSYIPNYGTAAGVTRSAETATGSGDAATFNSEGVLMAEISALANDGTDRVLSLNDGSANNRIVLYYNTSNNLIAQVYSISNTIQATITVNDLNITNLSRISIKYDTNSIKLYLNGFLKGTQSISNAPINLSELDFDNGIGSANFYGNTKQLQYFDTALTDIDLEKLTSWVSFQDMAESQLYSIE